MIPFSERAPEFGYERPRSKGWTEIAGPTSWLPALTRARAWRRSSSDRTIQGHIYFQRKFISHPPIVLILPPKYGLKS